MLEKTNANAEVYITNNSDIDAADGVTEVIYEIQARNVLLRIN